MPRLTAEFIESTVKYPASGQVIIRDDETVGFGLRVTKHCMSFVVDCRTDSKFKRVTIGRYGEITPEVARSRAREILTEQMGKRCCKVPTLAETLERYVGTKRLRNGTIGSYRQVMRVHLAEWLPLPVTAITKEMVASRYKEMEQTPATANLVMRVLRAVLNFAAENYESRHGNSLISQNPVRKLSVNNAWYREPRRQSLIPDKKLAEWYQSVARLEWHTARDVLLFIMFTGVRKNEAFYPALVGRGF